MSKIQRCPLCGESGTLLIYRCKHCGMIFCGKHWEGFYCPWCNGSKYDSATLMIERIQ